MKIISNFLEKPSTSAKALNILETSTPYARVNLNSS